MLNLSFNKKDLVMTTVELKNILIHRIAGINDKSFLTAIKTIVDKKSDSVIYKTTPEQRMRIKEGREQIARGEHFTNEQIELEIDKWLNEK
jgi:predicted transcriptional regulator